MAVALRRVGGLGAFLAAGVNGRSLSGSGLRARSAACGSVLGNRQAVFGCVYASSRLSSPGGTRAVGMAAAAGEDTGGGAAAAPLKGRAGVVFDMDGTLTAAGGINFARLRERIGCPAGEGILEHVAAVEDEDRRAELMAIVEEEERLGLEATTVRPEAAAVLDKLREAGLRTALITRNNAEAVEHVTQRLLKRTFSLMLDRDSTPEQPKPHPAGLLHICEKWGVSPDKVVMVGDHGDDVECGKAAGTATVLIGDPDHEHFVAARPQADHAVGSLDELLPLLGLPSGLTSSTGDTDDTAGGGGST